ncbi:MAG: ferredoxin family protein [Phycisphaerae bacterium]
MTILYCHCAYADVVPEATKQAVRAALADADGRVEEVADLCELAAAGDARLADLAAGNRPLHIVACYDRAVRHLFEFAGTPLPGSATVHNMRTEAPEAILARLGVNEADVRARRGSGGSSSSAMAHDTPDGDNRVLPHPARKAPAAEQPGESGPLPFPAKAPDDWIAWYPVIDYDRCVSCGQCAEFCLFGAYDVDSGGRVRVAHPAKCKLNCPACARVCPKSAIIFPKFPDGGPIAGDEGTLGAGAEAGMQTDLDRLGRGDVYEALRRRAADARAAAQAKAAERERAAARPEDDSPA